MLDRRSDMCLSFANGEYAIQFLVQPASFCFASHLHLFSVALLAINPLLVFHLTYLFSLYRQAFAAMSSTTPACRDKETSRAESAPPQPL
jgi:ABC-type multidrug transport system permease subunit